MKNIHRTFCVASVVGLNSFLLFFPSFPGHAEDRSEVNPKESSASLVVEGETVKKGDYDIFVELDGIIYQDLALSSPSSMKTSSRRLKGIEKALLKEISAAAALPPTRQAGRSTVKWVDPDKTGQGRIKNIQLKYSSEIFMLAENYRRALGEMKNEKIKFSNSITALKVHRMLEDRHAFYQKLLQPNAGIKVPELVSHLRLADEAESDVRTLITMNR